MTPPNVSKNNIEVYIVKVKKLVYNTGMKTQLFRYILTPTQMKLSKGGQTESKKEIMQKLLGDKFDFYLNDKEFGYRVIKQIGNDFILSKIGKRAMREHDLKENDDFIKKKEEEWPHRRILIDTNEKVQLVAFEMYKESEFNSPHAVLNTVAKILNENLLTYGWHIEFEPIFDKQQFWSVINRYQGKIKALELAFYVPNLFGTDDALSGELEGAKQNFTAQKVETKLINEEGNLTVPNNKFIQEGIELIRKGGGKYGILVKGFKKKITSTDEKKFVEIDDILLSGDDEKELAVLLKEITE